MIMSWQAFQSLGNNTVAYIDGDYVMTQGGYHNFWTSHGREEKRRGGSIVDRPKSVPPAAKTVVAEAAKDPDTFQPEDARRKTNDPEGL